MCTLPRACVHPRGGGGEGQPDRSSGVHSTKLNPLRSSTSACQRGSRNLAPSGERHRRLSSRVSRRPSHPPPPRNFRHAVRILTLNLRSSHSGYVFDLAESQGDDESGRGRRERERGAELIMFSKGFNLTV